MIIRDEASGHLLIDECLALLFVVYIDPAFGVYLLERVTATRTCAPLKMSTILGRLNVLRLMLF